MNESLELMGRVFTAHDLSVPLGPRRASHAVAWIVLVQDRVSGLFSVVYTPNLHTVLRGLRTGNTGYGRVYAEKYTTPKQRIENAKVYWTALMMADLKTFTRINVELALALEGKLLDPKRQASLQKNKGPSPVSVWRYETFSKKEPA